jgi:hypothetical protein
MALCVSRICGTDDAGKGATRVVGGRDHDPNVALMHIHARDCVLEPRWPSRDCRLR